MKAFSPIQLISESNLTDTLHTISGGSKSKMQLKLEGCAKFDNQIRDAKYNYYKDIMNESYSKYDIENAKCRMDSIIESVTAQKESFIHGIEVDADTIFDNGTDDFNKTEWMDLTLEAAYNLDNNIANIQMAQFVDEGMIWMRENASFDEIHYLNEAVVGRMRAAVKKGIEAVKAIISKFIEKLRSINKNHIPYLKKYKATILQQRPKSEIVKIKDFETAITRIMNTTVPNINYNEIKNAIGQETENIEQLIFDKVIKGKANMNNIQAGPDATIADVCKMYFQCAEQSPLIERDMQSFNMTNIYNFLFDAQKIINQVNKDMKAIETNANMLLTASEKESGQAQAQPDNNPQPQNASAIRFTDSTVYSAVTESYITLQEFEAVKSDKKDTNTSMDKRMNNVSGDKYADQNAADADAKAGGVSQNTRNEVAAYVKVAQTVLAAKITSVEFFQKELFQLVRHHVSNFIQGETETTSAQQGTV